MWITGSYTVMYSPSLLKPSRYCKINPWLALSGIRVHVRFALDEVIAIAWKPVTTGGTVGKKKEEKKSENVQTNFRVRDDSDV